MNWTKAELSPKFSLETMHWELSLYPLCPAPLSILNISASLICCWNTWMCSKRRPEMALYFHWKPVKFNFQWPCCFLKIRVSVTSVFSAFAHLVAVETRTRIHNLFTLHIIQGLHSNGVFYDGLAAEKVLPCFRAVCVWLISVDGVVDGVVDIVPHLKTILKHNHWSQTILCYWSEN